MYKDVQIPFWVSVLKSESERETVTTARLELVGALVVRLKYTIGPTSESENAKRAGTNVDIFTVSENVINNSRVFRSRSNDRTRGSSVSFSKLLTLRASEGGVVMTGFPLVSLITYDAKAR